MLHLVADRLASAGPWAGVFSLGACPRQACLPRAGPLGAFPFPLRVGLLEAFPFPLRAGLLEACLL